MHRDPDEDLFESSKMTFGEHLDELRRALLKALLALTIGFLIGLYFAGHLIEFVQTPLKAALQEHHHRKAIADAEGDASGNAIIPDRSPTGEAMVAERRYVDIRELMAALVRAYPDLAEAITTPEQPDLEIDEEKPDSGEGGPEEQGDAAKEESEQSLIPLTLFVPADEDPRLSTIATAMQDPFLVYIKASFVLGFILASPFIFYFLWEFVAAGLYPHEKHYVHIFLPFSIGLFFAGAALAFFFALDYVLNFLIKFCELMGVSPVPRITEWLNFVLVLPIGFGISFQLPLVMLFLERIGLVSVKTYWSQWRIAILVIAILSMVLTPADPQSMILMGVPLIFLYFGGILLCHFLPRQQAAFTDE